jgi:integrase
MERHKLLGGRLHLYKRGTGGHWHCSTYLAGKEHRKSTHEESFSLAKEVAEDWFFELKGKQRTGELKAGKTFRVAAEQFLKEYLIITQGQRNQQYVQGHHRRVKLHLLPFFGDLPLAAITSAKVMEYRMARSQTKKHDRMPARGTIHQEIVVLRQILKTAQRHQWLDALPDLSLPYRGSGKVTHRAWFSAKEYRQLYTASRKWAKKPPLPHWKHSYEQVHDYILFMANTGLRPDEALRLEFRDVNIVKDEATNETILEIEVRGKRGVGYCKSMNGAVRPFLRLKNRAKPQTKEQIELEQPTEKPKTTDRVFPTSHPRIFNALLAKENLKFDRDGNRRAPYSLRHTYICLRLLEGADIYQLAKNCRTSVEMIEKHYAVHLKNTLDAAAINVRKSRTTKKKADEEAE